MTKKMDLRNRFTPLNASSAFWPFAILLFVFLFIYLLVRAIFNEPIQDELATFSTYIQSGLPHNNNVKLDANNHLLNTYLSGIVYFFSGNSSFFWMRLPNLLSFPLYFFSVYFLLKRLQTPFIRYTGLIALTCIPFVIEYFAYCRGYGLSFAFLTFSLLQLTRFLDGTHPRAYTWGIISIVLATCANMGMMPLCLFVFGYFLLTSLSRQRRNFRFILLCRVLPAFVYLACLAYLLIYSFQLKKAGALYWGGSEGLWGTTGVSLTTYILFQVREIWKYILIVILLLFGCHLVWLVIKQKTAAFRRTDFTFILLLFGLLLFLECSFVFLGLNYPLDRGGLHLTLLFLLSLVYVLDYWKAGKVLHWSLLYFIWPFVTHLSIHSSVYSPGDRMTDKLYAQILPYLGPHTSVFCNSHLARSFYYQEQRNGQFHYAASGMEAPVYSDIWISRTDAGPPAPETYSLIAHDEAAKTSVYRKKRPDRTTRIAAKGSSAMVKQERLTNIYSLVPQTWIAPKPGEHVVVELDGRFLSPAEMSNMDLGISGFDADGNSVYYSGGSLRIWLQGRKINQNFHTRLCLEGADESLKKIAVYLWSPTGEHLTITDLDYRIYLVKQD